MLCVHVFVCNKLCHRNHQETDELKHVPHASHSPVTQALQLEYILHICRIHPFSSRSFGISHASFNECRFFPQSISHTGWPEFSGIFCCCCFDGANIVVISNRFATCFGANWCWRTLNSTEETNSNNKKSSTWRTEDVSSQFNWFT